MKRFSLYFTGLVLMCVIASCKQSGKSLLTPQASGKPYEILAVVDDRYWVPSDSALFEILDSDVPALPQPERSFRISRIPTSRYDGMMKIFRNIVIVDVQNIYTQTKLKYARDVFSSPQVIMTIQSPSRESLDEYLAQHGRLIVDFFTKVEMSREIALLKKQHNTVVDGKVNEIFDCHIAMPLELKSYKIGENFLWASSELNDLNFVMYSFPYTDKNYFTQKNFVAKRDSVLKVNLPGASEGMYMQTQLPDLVQVHNTAIKGEYVLEARGLWEMKNDNMGGPFVAHARVDKKNGRVIVVEGFVYRPGKLKRDFIRKLHAALYTLQLPGETEPGDIEFSEQVMEEKISEAGKASK